MNYIYTEETVITDEGKPVVIFHYRGKSTATKPTTCVAGSDWLETDTTDYYVFDGASWHKVS